MGKRKNKKKEKEKEEEEIKEDNFNFTTNQDKVLSSTDIIVDSFSITIGKKQLFVDSSLSICKGRKYGLIGINGAGKTTLMSHIARRKIKYSDQIDVLYVEQEIEPSEETVLNTVLSANTKRIELLNREKELQCRLETDEDVLDEYNQVCNELNAINADKDISIVIKLLFGLGFSLEEQKLPTNFYSY